MPDTILGSEDTDIVELHYVIHRNVFLCFLFYISQHDILSIQPEITATLVWILHRKIPNRQRKCNMVSLLAGDRAEIRIILCFHHKFITTAV